MAVKMKLADNVHGFGCGGVELEVHEGNIVYVPDQFVQAAKDHGLEIVEAGAPKREAKTAAVVRFKKGDMVSFKFEGEEEDIKGPIKSVKGTVATIAVEDGNDVQVDFQYLTLVEEE